jgi:DNA polymerase III delta subunit
MNRMIEAASRPNSSFKKAEYYQDEFDFDYNDITIEDAANEIAEEIVQSLKDGNSFGKLPGDESFDKQELIEILETSEGLDIYNETPYDNETILPLVRDYFISNYFQKISSKKEVIIRKAKTNKVEKYKKDLAKKVKKMIEESTERRMVQIQDDILHIILKALGEN